MAQSAAELRARVHAVNEVAEQAVAGLQSVLQNVTEAHSRYSTITDKELIVSAAHQMLVADQAVQQAIAAINQAISDASTYTTTF